VASILIVVVSLGVGAALLFEQQKDRNREAARYGDKREIVVALQAAVEKDRCNTATAVELSKVLDTTDNLDEATKYLQAVVDNCPADGPLLTRLARLYRRLGDHSKATRSASQLVALRPRHSHSYLLRAELFEDSGQLTKAVADYEKAFALNPAVAEAAQSLAKLLEQNNQNCRAAEVLDEFLARGRSVDAEALSRRSKALRESGSCKRLHVSGGQVTVAVRHRDNVMLVNAKINGHDAILIVDTGASSVALSREFANRVGIDTNKGTVGVVITASGRTSVTRLELNSVTVGGASLLKVGATVVDSMRLGDADGLLGNTFLSHFDVHVDSAKSQLILKKR
jgi:aspartyl protease family protein